MGGREVRCNRKEGAGLLMETGPFEIQRSKRLAALYAPGYEERAQTEEHRGGGLGYGLLAGGV
jgi:hypothetical protein